MTEMDDFNATIVEEFRANQGKVGGRFEASSLLLLHMTGAKSGRERLKPLAYQAVGNAFAVFASFAGAPKNPDWFHNLVANPDVTIEVGTETIPASARVTEGDERESIWSTQKQRFSHFAEYEQKAAPREIPVVLLERRS